MADGNAKEPTKATDRVLVCDDAPENVELLEALLVAEGYEVVCAYHGEECISKALKEQPDLILLDVVMPGLSGFDVCRQLKENDATRFIPIVMITALSELEDKIKGIEVGADEFLIKPINKMELVARAKSLVRAKRLHDQLDNAENVIYSLALAIEAKDPYTEGHTERVGYYASELAKRLDLSEEYQQTLKNAGALHDVGKMGVSEAILQKPGPLTEMEMDEIRNHSAMGERICKPLRIANLLLPIIRHHHERWDGTGYPDGLKGQDIPIGARIMAIADAFDAMTTDRPYRARLSEKQAINILRTEAGAQWDPELVQAFVALINEENCPENASESSRRSA